MTKNKLLRSSIILISANAIAKLLGAVFKIPLTYILLEDGMAVYNTAFSVYVTVMSITLGGFPFALTKLLAEHNALGRTDRIRPPVYATGLLLFVFGALGGAFMYTFAPQLAAAMREPQATGAIRAIAPALPAVALGAAFKSSNEATSDLIPTAVSQVLEAVLKLFAGFYLAYAFIKISVASAAKGAIFGVTVGEFFATALLGTVWFFRTKKYPSGKICGDDIHAVCRTAFPLAIFGAVGSALSMCSVPVMRGALSAIRFTPESAQNFLLRYSSHTDAFDTLPDTLRLTQEGIRKLYGAYSGYAHTVFNLPVGIIATVSAASTPMTATALTHSDNAALSRTTERIISLVLFFGVPSSFVCFFFSDKILSLLFHTDFAAPMLSALAPAIIFICSANMLAAVLHLSGRIFEPFVAGAASTVLQLLLCAVLVRISVINILGAPLACTAAAIFSFTANAALIRRHFGIKLHFLRLCAVPFSASCLMCALMLCLLPPLSFRFGKIIAFTLSCIAGAMCYLSATYLLSRRGGYVVIGKK